MASSYRRGERASDLGDIQILFPWDGLGSDGVEEDIRDLRAKERLNEKGIGRSAPPEKGSAASSPKKNGLESVNHRPEKKRRIEDYGEHLGGARKDEYTTDLFDKGGYATLEDKIKNEPLDKVFPAPNYKHLLKNGVSEWKVAFIHAVRDGLRKPTGKLNNPYFYNGNRMKNYVREVKEALEMTEWLLSDKKISSRLMFISRALKECKTKEKVDEVVRTYGPLQQTAEALICTRLNGWADNTTLRMELYKQYGHDVSFKALRLARGIPRGAYEKKLYFINDRRSGTPIIPECKTFEGWGGEGDYFVEGELERIAQSPQMRLWYENKKESLRARAQEKSLTGGVRLAVGHLMSEYTYNIYATANRIPIKLYGPFATESDAKSYLSSHKQELARIAKEEIKRSKERTLAPRVGSDYRRGKDVTPKEFARVFGFRGIEFGNWVDQGRRQKDLNEAYDAFMDLADVLDLPPKALSLNGSLGVGFGSRGKGGRNPAAAHFEPNRVVINLTKPNGPGCLAHEWMHAVDNYFSRKLGEECGHASARDVTKDKNKLLAMEDDLFEDALSSGSLKGVFSEDDLGIINSECTLVFEKVRISFQDWKHDEKALSSMKAQMEKVLKEYHCPEEKRSGAIDAFLKTCGRIQHRDDVLKALSGIPQAIKERTDMHRRSCELDVCLNKQFDPYWSTTIEEVARAFETYVDGKLKGKGELNEYLASEWSEEEKKRLGADTYPYPLKSELPVINEAFDKLFETIKTRETDRGIEMYSLKDRRELEEAHEQISISDIAERVKGAQVVDLDDGRFILRFKNNCEWLVNPVRDHIDIDPEVVKRDYGRRATIDDVAVGRTCVFGKNAFIQLVSGMSSPATFSHEVFEASWGMLTKEEQKVLTDKYGTRENCAEHYAQFLEGRLESERSNGAVRKIFERIKDFFESLRCCLFGPNSQDVFKRIESGAVMERNKSYGPELVYECTVNLADAEEEEYFEDLPEKRSGASFKDALERLRDESLSEERSSDYGMGY